MLGIENDFQQIVLLKILSFIIIIILKLQIYICIHKYQLYRVFMNQVFELGGSFQIDRKYQCSISCLQQSFQSQSTMDNQQLYCKCMCETQIKQILNKFGQFLQRPKHIIEQHEQEQIIFSEYLEIKYKEKVERQRDQFTNLRDLFRGLTKQVNKCENQKLHKQSMLDLSQSLNQCKQLYILNKNEVFAFNTSIQTQIIPKQCSQEEIALVKNVLVSDFKNSQVWRIYKKDLVRSSQKELENKKIQILEVNQDFRIKQQILMKILKEEEEKQDLATAWKELEAHNEQTISLIDEILEKRMKASQFTFGQKQV